MQGGSSYSQQAVQKTWQRWGDTHRVSMFCRDRAWQEGGMQRRRQLRLLTPIMFACAARNLAGKGGHTHITCACAAESLAGRVSAY
jgi:hypothetical protein